MAKYGWRNNKLLVKELEFPDKLVQTEIIPKTVAVSTAAILAGWDVSAGTASKTNTDFLIQPPYPLNLSVQAWAAGTAGGGDNLTIVGIDAKGRTITENVYVQATAQGINYTNNCFAKITSITPDDALHKSTDVNIGLGSALGLAYDLASAGDIITYEYDGAYSTADASGVPVNTTYDKIHAPVMAAAKTIRITYKTKFKNAN